MLTSPVGRYFDGALCLPCPCEQLVRVAVDERATGRLRLLRRPLAKSRRVRPYVGDGPILVCFSSSQYVLICPLTKSRYKNRQVVDPVSPCVGIDTNRCVSVFLGPSVHGLTTRQCSNWVQLHFIITIPSVLIAKRRLGIQVETPFSVGKPGEREKEKEARAGRPVFDLVSRPPSV